MHLPFLRRSTVLYSEPRESASELVPSVPLSTNSMVYAASRSVRAALDAGMTRQTVEMFVPLLPTTKPEDLHPWPGGLRQMATVALPIARDVLRAAVKGGGDIEERVLVVAMMNENKLLINY